MDVIKTISDLPSFAALAAQWNTLPGARANPLLAHEWLLTCAEAFVASNELYVVTVLNGGRLIAVAPLRRAKRRGVPRLELLGTTDLYEPCGLLHADARAFDALVDALSRQPYSMRLQRIEEAGEIHARLKEAYGRATEQPGDAVPYLEITTTWDTYFRSLSPRRRYDFRRARKQLEARGAVTFDMLCPEPGALDEVLDTAFAIEATGWKGRNRSALRDKRPLQTFFRRYAARACALGTLRTSFLTVGGTRIAMQISVVHANRFWVLKTGYDETWKEYSPGIQLTMETVRYAHEQGHGGYEFLGSHEPWIEIWTKATRALGAVAHYPNSTYGLVARGIDAAVSAVQRLVPYATSATTAADRAKPEVR